MFRKSLIDPQSGSISLRCLAVKRDGQYVAACLDLCLAAQADTDAEARQKLHDQIIDYLADAWREKCFETRPAPAEYWLLYLSLRAKEKAKSAARHVGVSLNGIGTLFKESVPLSPDFKHAA